VSNAQLGEVSRLTVGSDQGWRGALDLDVTARGTLNRLQLASKAEIHQFRRFDVATEQSVSVSSQCSALLNSSAVSRALDAISCTAPIGNGQIQTTGYIRSKQGALDYDMTADVQHVRVEALAAILRNARQNVAPDLKADGTASGKFEFLHVSDGAEHVVGSGSISGLTLASSRLSSPMAIGDLHFMTEDAMNVPAKRKQKKNTKTMAARAIVMPATSVGDVGELSGRFDSQGYGFDLHTNTRVARLQEVAGVFGIAPTWRAMAGSATGSLRLSGSWTGYQHAVVTADMQLHDVDAELGKLHRVHVAQAHLALTPERAAITDMTAELLQPGIPFTGSMSYDRPCRDPLECNYQFDVRVPQLTLAGAKSLVQRDNGFLATVFQRGSWLEQNRADLDRVRGNGHLRIDEIRSPTWDANNVAADVRIADGKAALQNLAISIAGGQLTKAAAAIDVSGSEPRFGFKGDLSRLRLERVAGLFAAPAANVSGTLDGSLQLEMAGDNAEDLSNSAEGNVQFRLSSGKIGANTDTFRFDQFHGILHIAQQSMTLQDATAVGSGGHTWQVAGTISFSRALDLRFSRASEEVTVKEALVNVQPAAASK
jgi:hypothetical protein